MKDPTSVPTSLLLDTLIAYALVDSNVLHVDDVQYMQLKELIGPVQAELNRRIPIPGPLEI